MKPPRIKIKKPHNQYIETALQKQIAWIKKDRNAGLYLAKLAKHDKQKLFGVKSQGPDTWIIYIKQPFKRKLTGPNYTWYGL
jgi:hypothetical protein